MTRIILVNHSHQRLRTPSTSGRIPVHGGQIAKKKFYQTNQYIQAEKLRVVDNEAKQIGVLTKAEALALAGEKGLDLVLVSPGAKPPVAKLINFANFKYQQKKKIKADKTRSKGGELKEIRLTPFIAENDLNTRLKKAREFLEEGDRVKVNVKFVGRQITKKEFGDKVMAKVVQALEDTSSVDQPARLHGKILSLTLKPSKKKQPKQIEDQEEN